MEMGAIAVALLLILAILLYYTNMLKNRCIELEMRLYEEKCIENDDDYADEVVELELEPEPEIDNVIDFKGMLAVSVEWTGHETVIGYWSRNDSKLSEWTIHAGIKGHQKIAEEFRAHLKERGEV